MNRLSLILGLIAFSISANAQFQLCNSPTSQNLMDIYFIDANVGVAVGDSGVIVRSIDGGLNWDQVHNNDTVDFKKVNFFDNQNGIAIGTHIFTTNDAGQTWAYNSHLNDYFFDVEIINQNTCIVSGYPSALIKSTDKGQTWNTLVQQNTINSEFGLLSFVNENIGYSCSYSGGLSTHTLKTIDGGVNWSLIEDPQFPNPTVMEAMSFTSEDIGFKAGWYNPHLQKTTNGANDWNHVVFTDSLFDYQLIDFHIKKEQPSSYFACGWYGNIFKSTDGGNTWSELDSPVSNTTTLYGIYFLDNNNGWIVGQNGTILKTINGGGTVGIDEINNLFELTIFPNPTDDILNVEINFVELQKEVTIKIFDSNGKLLVEENGKNLKAKVLNINLNKFSNGNYFIQLTSEIGVKTKRFIVQN